jgi:glycosyltransferase involved in cell wall biosynthesis
VTVVHVVVPTGIDDPGRPSGGNTYDRRACRELISLGWSVHEHTVPGSWPRPDPPSLAALADVMKRIPDDSVVMLDGLVASPAPEVLVAHAHRLRLVVLVHMSLGHGTADDGAVARTLEGAALSVAAAIVTTSDWTRRTLLDLYALPDERLHVVEPGVDPAPLATGTGGGGALLCVAAVCLHKGHDVLVDGLETVTDLPWHCVCVGSLDRDPEFAADVRRRCLDAGLGDRVCFAGPRTGSDLDRSYAAADLVVLASRAEAYGMVLTEALSRGLPVVAAEVGGTAQAVGHGADGTRPGLLVPPEDAAALGAALRSWLSDPALRGRLRRAASERRESLSSWSNTASRLAAVLGEASRMTLEGGPGQPGG